MQATQSFSPAGYTDLFASLQTVQATVQSQVDRFHELMAEIKVVSAVRQDEDGVRVAGEVALKLHRVYTLLFGGATVGVGSAQNDASAAGSGDIDLNSALAEFSTLLATSQNTSNEVALLLAQAGAELAQLRATIF